MRTLHFPCWSVEGSLRAPIFRKDSLSYKFVTYLKIKFFTPLIYSLNFSIKFYNFIIVSVVGLFVSCCPPTVRRFIVSVYVYSVKSKSLIPRRKHIFIERNKVVPPFAYFYSTRAVILIIISFCVKATLTHIYPRMIDRVPPNAILRIILNCGHSVLSLFPGATTTISFPVNNIRFSTFNLFPTITLKKPNLVITNIRHSYKFNWCQRTELLLKKLFFQSCVYHKFIISQCRIHYNTI